MADSPWPRVQALTLFRTMRRQHIEPDAVCYEVRGAHAPHARTAPHARARAHARTHAHTHSRHTLDDPCVCSIHEPEWI